VVLRCVVEVLIGNHTVALVVKRAPDLHHVLRRYCAGKRQVPWPFARLTVSADEIGVQPSYRWSPFRFEPVHLGFGQIKRVRRTQVGWLAFETASEDEVFIFVPFLGDRVAGTLRRRGLPVENPYQHME